MPCFLTSVLQPKGPFFSHRTHTAERGNNSSSGGDFLVGFWRKMLGVADSVKNVSFFSCCLSETAVEQHGWVSPTCSLIWFIFLYSLKLSLLPLFSCGSLRVSQPLTFNCWISVNHWCLSPHIPQSPRKSQRRLWLPSMLPYFPLPLFCLKTIFKGC